MKNIGYVSHDHTVRMMINQLKDNDDNFGFYAVDDELKVIDQYAITHIVFDFNNFDSLQDSLLYQRLNQRSDMRFLIIGNEISELLHNEFKIEKSIAHLLKPTSSESLYGAVKFHLLNQKEEHSKNQLLSSRFYNCLLGYYFLNKAVQYCHDNQVDESVRMAVIYDHIAVNYHTTKSTVEKSIRKLITAFKNERHWTNSEIILYFYEKLCDRQREFSR